VLAEEQAVGERVGLPARPAVLALEQVAAKLERAAVDQRRVLAGVDVATARPESSSPRCKRRKFLTQHW
jgi:hypothetical protein